MIARRNYSRLTARTFVEEPRNDTGSVKARRVIIAIVVGVSLLCCVGPAVAYALVRVL